MMKKKLLALLTAVACLSSLGGLTASAAMYTKTKSGGIGTHYQCEMFKGFLVETDGTELSEDMLKDIHGFSTAEPLDNFTYYVPWGVCRINYKPKGTAYMVGIDSDDPETLTKLGRSLMLSQDCITQVRLVEFEKYGIAVAVPYINIRTTNKTVTINSEVIPELEGFAIYSEGYGYAHYKFQVRRKHVSDCDCELCSDLRGISQGSYAYYERVQEFADALVAKYGDLISSAEADVAALESPSETSSSDDSVWQTAGDCNADGTVNAQDAAEQLIAAANAATGGTVAVTGANDVNADGAVNALDAAAVLAYAAAQGSGQAPEWVDILR